MQVDAGYFRCFHPDLLNQAGFQRPTHRPTTEKSNTRKARFCTVQNTHSACFFEVLKFLLFALKFELVETQLFANIKFGLQRGLNPWPRDTAAMLYQLSYEATDVRSRPIVGSYVPVREMGVNDIWNKSYVNCGNEEMIVAVNAIYAISFHFRSSHMIYFIYH